ncbi:hypothetical protein LPJ73_007024, partial [Coemansia sp. RSA 2703]
QPAHPPPARKHRHKDGRQYRGDKPSYHSPQQQLCRTHKPIPYLTADHPRKKAEQMKN